jgi:hypothetical protein
LTFGALLESAQLNINEYKLSLRDDDQCAQFTVNTFVVEAFRNDNPTVFARKQRWN